MQQYRTLYLAGVEKLRGEARPRPKQSWVGLRRAAARRRSLLMMGMKLKQPVHVLHRYSSRRLLHTRPAIKTTKVAGCKKPLTILS